MMRFAREECIIVMLRNIFTADEIGGFYWRHVCALSDALIE